MSSAKPLSPVEATNDQSLLDWLRAGQRPEPMRDLPAPILEMIRRQKTDPKVALAMYADWTIAETARIRENTEDRLRVIVVLYAMGMGIACMALLGAAGYGVVTLPSSVLTALGASVFVEMGAALGYVARHLFYRSQPSGIGTPVGSSSPEVKP